MRAERPRARPPALSFLTGSQGTIEKSDLPNIDDEPLGRCANPLDGRGEHFLDAPLERLFIEPPHLPVNRGGDRHQIEPAGSLWASAHEVRRGGNPARGVAPKGLQPVQLCRRNGVSQRVMIIVNNSGNWLEAAVRLGCWNRLWSGRTTALEGTGPLKKPADRAEPPKDTPLVSRRAPVRTGCSRTRPKGWTRVRRPRGSERHRELPRC